jgi:hypothetical protein
MRPIEYAEYKEVLDILKRDNVEDSYQDLLSKESEVLDTVNNVVKYYRDNDMRKGEFINQDITHIVVRLVDVWGEVITELVSVSSYKDFIGTITKGDRPIYLGLTFILLALFLFLIESSKW